MSLWSEDWGLWDPAHFDDILNTQSAECNISFPILVLSRYVASQASQSANNLTQSHIQSSIPDWGSEQEFHTFHTYLSQSIFYYIKPLYYSECTVHPLHILIRIQLNTDTEIIITADNWITYALIFRVHIWDLTGMIVLQMRISLHSPSLHSGFLVHSPHKAAFVSYMNATMDPERD